MAQNKSVTLGKHFDKFVDDQVKAGRFSSTSEVLRAGLRLLEDEEAKLKALRAALSDGLDSGETVTFDNKKFLARKRKQHAGA